MLTRSLLSRISRLVSSSTYNNTNNVVPITTTTTFIQTHNSKLNNNVGARSLLRSYSSSSSSSSSSSTLDPKQQQVINDRNESIDFQNSVEIRGLPSSVTRDDIVDMFKGLSISNNGIKMVFDDIENEGFAFITFDTSVDKQRALATKPTLIVTGTPTDVQIYPLSISKTDWKSISKSSYMNRTAITNHLWRSRTPLFNVKSKSKGDQTQPISRSLVDKAPQESYTEIYLHFNTDLQLREMYLSPYGHLRVGRFLEDLDALAGTVSYKHAEDTTEEKVYTIVTASVDRIHLLRPLNPQNDIKMDGIVTWVGKSSMEIMIKARALNSETGQWEGLLVAYFTMVARDPFTKKSALVNRLVPTNEKETRQFDDGEKHKSSRLDYAKKSLHNVPPTNDELQIIHDLFMRSKDDKTKYNWLPMQSTSLQTVILCQPQERNMHGNIFGGYLMRKGFEIAFTTCFLQFNSSIPQFLGMDDITFLLPVDIGNILTLEATIVYTETVEDISYVQVEVFAYVSVPLQGGPEKKLSNTFNFTFICKESVQDKPKRVLPQSYAEAMRHLGGKRIVDRQKHYSKDDVEIWK
ncbi:hypothetical protein SAMD00019534_059810 [Acytostelium subglobosum LB1]|uniref:hypothetical protein n=1 Tax=Acytostelium subglobosum LB1 TaxID=1410327 RepID=UPI0006452027|nr:hypothetical protein SAMD00019534_059810 [Acytostelium subglobosum LB1]GAM22806.1 hypothetical protein SAMD00019534_059810 [Acytostelium subglobosum LB1]|eukprot:XP_012754033.1 hypothetical protein SAMD00019534_059810 [Acytostelium subglobosum LB1]